MEKLFTVSLHVELVPFRTVSSMSGDSRPAKEHPAWHKIKQETNNINFHTIHTIKVIAPVHSQNNTYKYQEHIRMSN